MQVLAVNVTLVLRPKNIYKVLDKECYCLSAFLSPLKASFREGIWSGNPATGSSSIKVVKMGQNSSSSLSSKDGTRAEDEMKIPTLQETFHINGQDSTHWGKNPIFVYKLHFL